MITTAIFPGRYVQGQGALSILGEEASRLGSKALLLCDPYVLEHMLDAVQAGLDGRLPALPVRFGGECSDEEVARLRELAEREGANVILGIGGGKTLDTAKALAYEMRARTLIVPTLASTDAPCSALSVIYHADGSFKRYLVLPHNPDTVLVDTEVIVRAPVRLLVAGMGDAFATWFEADHCRSTRGANMTGRQGPLTAYALARLCHETLLEYGPLAKLSAEQGVVTPALEHIVEANTLLSGLGFESGGLAAAHAIHNGLTVLADTHHAWHGEKVAIGIQAMMFLADQKPELIDTVFDFSMAVGLPVTLADIGLATVDDAQLLQVATRACAPGETIHNEPAEITPQRVLAALKVADAEGRRRQALAAPR